MEERYFPFGIVQASYVGSLITVTISLDNLSNSLINLKLQSHAKKGI